MYTDFNEFHISCASLLYCKYKIMTMQCTDMFAFSGSHVVIQLVEKYPAYFIVNLDKVL